MVTSSPELMSYCKKPVDQSAMIINTAWGNTDAVFYWIKTFCHRDLCPMGTQRTQSYLKLGTTCCLVEPGSVINPEQLILLISVYP